MGKIYDDLSNALICLVKSLDESRCQDFEKNGMSKGLSLKLRRFIKVWNIIPTENLKIVLENTQIRVDSFIILAETADNLSNGKKYRDIGYKKYLKEKITELVFAVEKQKNIDIAKYSGTYRSSVAKFKKLKSSDVSISTKLLLAIAKGYDKQLQKGEGA